MVMPGVAMGRSLLDRGAGRQFRPTCAAMRAGSPRMRHGRCRSGPRPFVVFPNRQHSGRWSQPASEVAPMSYVDGFVVPVPQENLAAYRRLARRAGAIWKEYGALEYVECVADGVQPR